MRKWKKTVTFVDREPADFSIVLVILLRGFVIEMKIENVDKQKSNIALVIFQSSGNKSFEKMSLLSYLLLFVLLYKQSMAYIVGTSLVLIHLILTTI